MNITTLDRWIQEAQKPSTKYKMYSRRKLSRADETWARLKRLERAQELSRKRSSMPVVERRGKTFLEPIDETPRTIVLKKEDVKPLSPAEIRRYKEYEDRNWY